MKLLSILTLATACLLTSGCFIGSGNRSEHVHHQLHTHDQESHHKMEHTKVRHTVMFKYKEGTSEADIKNIVNEFRALPKKIKSIRDFEYGSNISPEGLDMGYTHVFLVTFNSIADRDAYLPHPAHLAFVDVLLPHLEEAHVMDYIAKD